MIDLLSGPVQVYLLPPLCALRHHILGQLSHSPRGELSLNLSQIFFDFDWNIIPITTNKVVPGRMALLVTLFLVLINIFNNVTNVSPNTEGMTAISSWMLGQSWHQVLKFPFYWMRQHLLALIPVSQSVSQWVIVSYFGDSYRIYCLPSLRACSV